jgi:hypothetical protein
MDASVFVENIVIAQGKDEGHLIQSSEFDCDQNRLPGPSSSIGACFDKFYGS